MKSKKVKLVLIICFLVIIICGIYYIIANWNVKHIEFKDVEKIYVNYYATRDIDLPTVTVELSQENKEKFLKGLSKCKFMKRKNPEESRWDSENYKFEEYCNYEVILNDNTKLKFKYNEEFDYMYNEREYQTTLYKDGEKFDGMCDIITTFKIIKSVDKELDRRG